MHTKSGKKLHPIGIGTWMIAGDFIADPTAKYKGAVPKHGNEQQEVAALQYSLRKGQNHIDCAELYGGFYTDEVVGRAIAGTKREDLFIADKLWKTSLEAGKVRPTVEKMLQKLGTDYLDMLYIHNSFDDVAWTEAIPQIDELIDEGIVRFFGVSNFSVADMQKTAEVARYPIAANQMEYSVLFKDEVSQEFRSYCEAHNIRIVAYQPLKRREVTTNAVIAAIAKTHHATPAQVALAWLLQQGTLPIPKATDTKHIDENVAAVALKLTPHELTQLNEL